MSRLKHVQQPTRTLVCLKCAHHWTPAAHAYTFPAGCFICAADASWLVATDEFYRLDRIISRLQQDPRVVLRRFRGVRGNADLGTPASARSIRAGSSPA